MAASKKKLSSRECAMGFVTLLVMIVAYYKYWYDPKKASLVDLDQKISAIQREIDQNKNLVDGLQKRIVASTGPGDKDPLKDYLATSQRLGKVVQQLVGDDKELVTRLINIEKTEIENDHKNVSFSVEVVGSFPAIGTFVERLETARVLAEVAAINITRVENDLEKCIAKISVNAQLYDDEATK